MKQFEKYKFITLIIITFGLGLTLVYLVLNDNKSDNRIEIYTLQDIYYINPYNLTVQSESGVVDLTFNNLSSLGQYMGKITSDDNQAGYDCLVDKDIKLKLD